MKTSLLFLTLTVFVLITNAVSSFAQTRTVGTILNDPRASNGYTLFAPNSATTTYLINNEGRQVHSWKCTVPPGQSVYLLESGNLLHTGQTVPPNSLFKSGGTAGKIQEYDWDGNLLWDFDYSTSTYCSHHDAKKLPNGNVLVIAWEYKTKDDAIAAGRDPSKLADNSLWPDHIIEVKQTGAKSGQIVWEWHVWNHLIQDFDPTKANYGNVAEHPELVDINFIGGPSADWLHTNGIAYNQEVDQIIISIHNLGEVWVIDHSTTTAEASSHSGGRSGKGGDILYRWGNPKAYRAGSTSDQKFFGQHDAHWIPKGVPGEGNILVFNNGLNRPGGKYSTVDEFTPPADAAGKYSYTTGSAYGPTTTTWNYEANPRTSFYSSNISGAQRQPNGNTLICNGANGILFEVTATKEVVWQYVNPVTATGILTQGEQVPNGGQGKTNSVFKIQRYAPDYPAFNGRPLTPGDFIEKYSSTDVEEVQPHEATLAQNYPNPFSDYTTIAFAFPQSTENLVEPNENLSLRVYDIFGREVLDLTMQAQRQDHITIFRRDVPSVGVYVYVLRIDGKTMQKKMIVRE